MPTELEREQAELRYLRDHGDPTSLHHADRLEKVYHVRQMDGLANDVYHAAKGEGQPPQGWTRLSEHPDVKRAMEVLTTGEFLAAKDEAWVLATPTEGAGG